MLLQIITPRISTNFIFPVPDHMFWTDMHSIMRAEQSLRDHTQIQAWRKDNARMLDNS